MEDFRILSFLTIVRSGSFSAAADALGVTQPAVSQHVKALESRYGVKLLAKRGNRPVVTEAGALLVKYGERLEAIYRLIDHDLANRRGSQRSYDVAATLTVAEYVLPALLADYQALHPDVRIRLAVQNTAGVVERLLRGQAVLGLVEGPVDRPEITLERLQEDDLIVVGAPGHPIVADPPARGVALERVLEADLILRESGSGTREVFERYLVSRRIDPRALRPFMEIGSINVIKSLVRSRLGITVISRLAVANELAGGALVEVRVNAPPIRRELTLAWTGDSDTEFVENFVAFCRAQRSSPPTPLSGE